MINNLGNEAQEPCPECMHAMRKHIFYNNPPPLLIVEYPGSSIRTSHKIGFHTETGPVYLRLRGIVYHGGNHFTSRIISSDGTMWYHDGISTGGVSIPDGHLNNITDQGIRNCKRRKLVLAVYAQD